MSLLIVPIEMFTRSRPARDRMRDHWTADYYFALSRDVNDLSAICGVSACHNDPINRQSNGSY
jgi:hypothetical protein